MWRSMQKSERLHAVAPLIAWLLVSFLLLSVSPVVIGHGFVFVAKIPFIKGVSGSYLIGSILVPLVYIGGIMGVLSAPKKRAAGAIFIVAIGAPTIAALIWLASVSESLINWILLSPFLGCSIAGIVWGFVCGDRSHPR